MIIGIGTDLIDINRRERTIARYGNRFINRVFTFSEQDKSEKRVQRVESYARRFAAKEACSKALGTGFREGVFWRDMGVVNLPGGKPTMELKGGAAKRLEEITPQGMQAHINLSITDEPPLAAALVIISATPKPSELES